ncbi:unnamed protein product [Meganyctiphanes norvegica]|uniref:Uncharacterized protein n=1 Tax=Meganyctiphanes norvegica TaxID=48144 RepID=A0AAV2PRG6_MEGNR
MLNLGLLTVQGNLGLLTVPVALAEMLNLGLLTVLGNLGLLTVPIALAKMLNLGLLTVQGNLGLLTVPVALAKMLNLGLLTVQGNLGLLTVTVALAKMSFDGSRELGSFDGSSGFGKNVEPGSFDGSRELGSFDGSSSFSKNVEPGSFEGSRELGSFDGSSGFGKNVEPGSFDGSRELGSFDGSHSLGKNVDLFENRSRGDVGPKISKLDLGTKEGNGISGKYVKQQNDTTCAGKMGYWKKGQRFQGLDPVTGMLISGKILGQAGKVTGVNKDCYNVQLDNDGWTGWFNLKRTLRELSEVNENIEMIILFSNDAVSLAKNKEIQTWIDNKVFEVVPNEGQRAISVRWIVTEKTKDDGLVIKARLVARGFEEDTRV